MLKFEFRNFYIFSNVVAILFVITSSSVVQFVSTNTDAATNKVNNSDIVKALIKCYKQNTLFLL